MDKKTECIVNQLRKSYINNKRYENYAITRIWHLLNRLDVKFITQQYVKRQNGYALIDLYFPQLKIQIEIDEGHHFTKEEFYSQKDKVREQEILSSAGLSDPVRIIVHNRSIENINNQIEKAVNKINNKINVIDFKPWDFEGESDPKTYIKKGLITLEDDVAFYTIADACNCFGLKYKQCRKAFYKHGVERDKMLWFPRFFDNQEWENSLSSDESEIYESKISDNVSYINKSHNKLDRIVFAKIRSNLGDIMYRFKGVYKLYGQEKNCLVYKRIDTKCKTYPSN